MIPLDFTFWINGRASDTDKARPSTANKGDEGPCFGCFVCGVEVEAEEVANNDLRQQFVIILMVSVDDMFVQGFRI